MLLCQGRKAARLNSGVRPHMKFSAFCLCLLLAGCTNAAALHREKLDSYFAQKQILGKHHVAVSSVLKADGILCSFDRFMDRLQCTDRWSHVNWLGLEHGFSIYVYTDADGLTARLEIEPSNTFL